MELFLIVFIFYYVALLTFFKVKNHVLNHVSQSVRTVISHGYLLECGETLGHEVVSSNRAHNLFEIFGVSHCL